MRTLLIPDVHEEIPQLEKLLSQAGPCDRRIFLGDWFDSFYRTVETTTRTAKWLVANCQNETDEFLFGNHDLPYAFPLVDALSCSGHSRSTEDYLATLPDIWSRFKLHTWVDGWLITHAGLHPELLPGLSRGEESFQQKIAAAFGGALAMLKDGQATNIVLAGESRGGRQPRGGVTWLDWDDEFTPYVGLKQVVGHTKARLPRFDGGNACIDTELRHYGIITDGDLTIFEVAD